MVSSWRILSREDHILEFGRICIEPPSVGFGPRNGSGLRERLPHIEAPTVQHGRAPIRIVGKIPARPRIMNSSWAMRSLEGGRDVGPRAKAGISQSLRAQPGQRLLIGSATFRLND
jgi:hypothetical protein